MSWGPIPIAASAGSQSMSGGINAAASMPIAVPAGASNTKGAWVEVVASTGFNATLIDLIILGTGTSGSSRHMLFDIGIGGSGSEVVLVPNILVGTANSMRRYTLPLWVPAGTRVAVRYQCTDAAWINNVSVVLHNTGHLQSETGASALAYGANPAGSTGTALAIPGAINTMGAWTQITASTSASLRSILVTATGPTSATWSSAPNALVDVGYGGSGSEQILLNGLPLSWATTEMTNNTSVTIPVNLPAGTRLAARYQATDIAQPASVALVGIS